MIGQRNQARTQKPVNGCGRVIHRQPNDIVIGLTARDFNNVVEMFVGRIDDALGLLQRRATSADLPIGQMQRSTNHRGAAGKPAVPAPIITKSNDMFCAACAVDDTA